MVDNYIHILKKNRLFESIDSQDIISMLKCLNAVLREYDKGEYIALAGESCDNIGILVKGSAAVTKEDINGNRVIMVLLKPGDIFGEVAAFASRPVWPGNVLAQEKSVVCFIPVLRITSLCSNLCQWHTVIIRNLLKTISEKAMALNRKVEYLTIKSMRGRICAFLLEQSKKNGDTTITIPMNRNQLADFLNVSRSSMSREMCRMRDEGIISFKGSTFRINDLDALKRMAGA